MRKVYLACFSFLLGSAIQAQSFTMVKDINPGLSNGNPNHLINIGGTLFFSANNGASGTELWKSNGTALGTVLVKDINPGAASSSPNNFFVMGGILYFRASNGASGVELWRSDGTAAGTFMLKDINAGAASSSPLHLSELAGTLIFSAEDAVNGREVWKSDGTAAGTVLLKNISPGVSDGNPSWFTQLGNKLYFAAQIATTGYELWATDGTAGGTALIKDIYPGATGSEPVGLITVNNILYFRAFAPVEGWTMIKSDGTGPGTIVLKPAGGISMPEWLTNIGGVLYFTSTQDELWKTNGTAAGTVMIKDMVPGPGGGFIQKMTYSNGLAFFEGTNGVNGYELWKSNGTAAGTVMVKDIIPGAGSSNIDNLGHISNMLYFSASNGVNGEELWKSDGTAAGTVLVQDFAVPGDGTPRDFTMVGNKFFLTANDESAGRELWVARLHITFGLEKTLADVRLSTLLIYPNPASEAATLMLTADRQEKLTYIIYDIQGKPLQQKSIVVTEGSNRINLETSTLAAGSYTVVVKGATTSQSIQFIKQ